MVTIVITSYIASVIFAIALQVVLFRTGRLRRSAESDVSIGLDILWNASLWPVLLVVLGFVWILERLGRITRE